MYKIAAVLDGGKQLLSTSWDMIEPSLFITICSLMGE